MKQIIYDAITKEITFVEVEETIVEPKAPEPTLEDRVAKVETSQDEIVNVLAEIVGVSV